MTKQRRRIHVDGVVQGVGFRPFIYNLARRHGLSGWVRNTSAGVDMEAEGAPDAVAAFEAAISAEAPPLARIDAVEAQTIPTEGGADFEIRHSESTGGISLVSPDAATCEACVREIFDPEDRRYRYPFTNCTHCGPRFTIIRGLPYDRPQTTMDAFPMCADCRAEYEDPLDRRFHAQPNACPVCGPAAWLEDRAGVRLAEGDIWPEAACLLRGGAIMAVKGLGGFHLACDARNPNAVAALRARKGRPSKPFAVMMRDLAMIRAYCAVSEAEADLLKDPAAPIVLLRKEDAAGTLEGVAPDNLYLGVMLPYTPLHHILLHDFGGPLVMTSGNHTDEPIAASNDAARAELADIADYFAMHNRPIHIRADDSVLVHSDNITFPLRRSRGYAPYPIALKLKAARPVLAVGAGMKNTLCFLREDQAFLSQHIGELDNLETLAFFEESARHLRDIFRVRPAVLAHDLHPDYLSTRWALGGLSVRAGVDDLFPELEARIGVQHHHAHIAACLAGAGREGPVIGLAWDGTGYGPDGSIWGGECLIADLRDYARAATLQPVPVPGGEAAIRNPWRLALGYCLDALGEVPDLPAFGAVPDSERDIVARQAQTGLNAPRTSSMGRLFDAVSALAGICTAITFEAQAAIALEMLATPYIEEGAKVPRLPVEIGSGGVIALAPLLRGIVKMVEAGREPGMMAAAFHVWATDVALVMALHAREASGLRTVALGGGVWQNRLLLALAVPRLQGAGFEVLVREHVPPGDGGLSLGQAAVAAASM